MNLEQLGPGARRRLGYAGFAGIVVVYLAIIQLGGLAIARLADESEPVTTAGVVFGMILPLGAALVFTIVIIVVLGWQKPVLRDDRPVRRWVWIVPAVFVVAILVGIDYSSLAQKDLLFILTLLIATQFVGWGEEAMFRGIGVTTLRDHGLSEGKVALWSSVIFGAVHLTNVIGHGWSAIPQAVVVSLAGYFFYLIRRVSGGNVLNSVIHGLFDFTIITGTVILVDQTAYVGAFAPILVYVVLGIVLFLARHRIEPVDTVGRRLR